MSKRFYEVIVLGADLGPLVAAAILAKRGFRVLVVGCRTPPDSYEEAGLRLPRGPAYLAVAGTPIVRRVFAELGLAQILKRKVEPLEPRFQVVLPRMRLDVTGDRERLRRELAREFPDAQRQAEAFYDRLIGLNVALDRFFSDELLLPPEGFFERRKFQRALLQNPFGPYGESADPWHELPPEHPFRLAVTAQVRFASRSDPDALTPLQVARLHGSWLAHGALFEGGPAGLRAFLRERIALHGGELLLDQGITSISVQRGRAVGVRLEGEEEVTGAEHVVSGLDLEQLLRCFSTPEPPGALADLAIACRPKYRRFACNLVVRPAAVPAGMARHVFLLSDPGFPPLEDNLLFLEVSPLDAERSVICAESFAPAERVARDGQRYLEDLSGRIHDRLRALFPFLDRHLLLRSSPWILPTTPPGQPPIRITPAEREARSPQSLPAVPSLPLASTLGLTCLGHRSGPRRLLLTGRDVIPGLGDEGVFLSAWIISRIITQKDPRRVRLRKELGTAVEPG